MFVLLTDSVKIRVLPETVIVMYKEQCAMQHHSSTACASYRGLCYVFLARRKNIFFCYINIVCTRCYRTYFGKT